jgi:hypothetical protein
VGNLCHLADTDITRRVGPVSVSVGRATFGSVSRSTMPFVNRNDLDRFSIHNGELTVQDILP